VIKVGDRAMQNALSDDGLDNLASISREMQTVLVHGGGDTVTRIAEKLGAEQKFIVSPEGFRSRFTDAETLEAFTMVMAGKINKEIVQRLLSRKILAVGVCGIDGEMIRAERKKRLVAVDERGRRKVIDGGYTGSITNIDTRLLRVLINAGYVPIVAPIALGTENETLNIDGDRTAARVAVALQAEMLLLITDVEAVSSSSGLIRRMSPNEAKQNLASFGPGMITKIHAALDAISEGVGKVVIAPGYGQRPYTAAIREETGTVIAP
jgi:acetylglutamate/LysW-gamma-L-alpha-aminoadipate kinase